MIQSLTSQEPLLVTGGTLAIDGNSQLEAALTLSGGTLSGNGTLTVVDTLEWTGGTMNGTGTTVIATGAQLNITGGSSKTLSRTLNNAGTANWTAGTFTVNGTFNNLAGASFDVSGDRSMNGSGSFNNAGLFVKSAGTGQANVNIPFTNTGVLDVRIGEVRMNSAFSVEGMGIVTGHLRGTLTVAANLLGNTRNADLFVANSLVRLQGGSAAQPRLLEVMSQDRGPVPAGFSRNFLYERLALTGAFVRLVDQNDNAAGSLPEALYVHTLIVPAGSTLDLNGLAVYARPAQLDGTVLNGTVIMVPDGGPLPFNSLVPGEIAEVGEVDEWSFFGRAGQLVSVLATTGGAAPNAPLAPHLGFASVELLDPAGNTLDEGDSTSLGEHIERLGVLLPDDGLYRLRVRAPDTHPQSVGNYQIGVYDATLDVSPLLLNQVHFGAIESAYSLDRWTFSVVAGQQVRFDLLNTSSPGTRFSLIGPGGLSLFENLTGSSELITLPLDGAYRLEALGDEQAAYAFRLDGILLTELPPNATHHGTFTGSGHAQLFRLPLAAPERFQVVLNDASDANHNELYVKFGAPPTRSDYQYRFTTSAAADQQVIVANALAGDWYILLYSAATPTPSDYTLRATTGTFFLSGVTPDHHGDGEDAVLTLTGAGFNAQATIALQAEDGAVYPAASVTLDFPTQITATFAAGSVPPGLYSVQVDDADGNSAGLPGAFRVLLGGAANLETNLVLPSAVGRHTLATIYVEYANTGTLAMPAPLLVFSATDRALLTLDATRVVAGFWTSAVPAGFSDTFQILGSGATAGVLQPGESVRVPVYYAGLRQPWDFSDNQVDFSLSVTTVNSAEIMDWEALQVDARPDHIPAEVWQPLWTHFAAETGTTWGDYVRMLNANAAYLSRLGHHVVNVDPLFNFALTQLSEMSPLPRLSEPADAEMPAPGLTLRLERSFGATLFGRHQLGNFGRGWSHTWDTSVQLHGDGTLEVRMDGAPRRFQPDSRGPSHFRENGDPGALTLRPGGGYLLREASGLTIAYHADGRLDYEEEPNGNRITASHAGGRLTALTHSSGQFLTLAYNAAGLVEKITDSSGRETAYDYDATSERLLAVHHADGRVTRYTYDTDPDSASLHALLSAEQEDGVSRHFTYDHRGRVSGTHLAGGAEPIVFSYPSQGQVLLTDASGAVSQRFFDHLGQVAKTVDPFGAAVFHAHDHNLNPIRAIDALGHVQESGFDAARNLTSRTDALGNTLAFRYDVRGRITSAIDANGNLIRYVRDANSNLVSTIYADGSAERGAYDLLGNLVRKINRRNIPIDQSWNVNGQLTQKSFVDGLAFDYDYDGRGNLATATDASGAMTFEYDDGDRITSVTYASGRSIAYSYDEAGRRIGMVDSEGITVNYSYDLTGRLARLSDADNQTIVAYGYDAVGRIIRKDQGNDAFTTYAYDAASQVSLLVNHAPNGSVHSRFEYTYDLAGRRTGMAMLDGEWTYAYDAAGRLTRAVFASKNQDIADQDLEYVYDAMGSRIAAIANGVATDYVGNNLNQVAAFGEVVQSYNADGNLVGRQDGSQVTTYQYDDESRLVVVVSAAGTWAYEYDALGNRKAVTHNGERTEYLLDPTGMGHVIGEYDSSGTLVASYIHGLGLVSRMDAGGAAAWYDFDSLGSTVGITDATGIQINSYSYLPFGETLAASEGIANPFTYVGALGVMAEDNGLFYMRNRFYDSASGAFINMDPLRLPGDHLYAYAANNPIQLVDPLGLAPEYLHGVCISEDCGPPGNSPPPPSAPSGQSLGNLLSEATGDRAGRHVRNGLLATTGRHDLIVPPGSEPGGVLGTIGSRDPNEKFGPGGFGPEGFRQPGGIFPYRINFENLESATAPAQRVDVTDQLDANLDWTTLELTTVGFGDVFLAVPPGSQYFQTSVAMTFNDQTFDVHIEITFDALTGFLRARFLTIDPDTLLPPGVLTGFLPPEDGTGRGQGHISYVIQPQAGLVTGDTIENIALIVFDSQQAIATNQVDPLDPSLGTDPALEARNTIDVGAPISRVETLAATSLSEFTVHWTGSDDEGGSGIKSYDVFVSINGAPFSLWLDDTTEISGNYLGEVGHTYAFYSQATDNVGFQEAAVVETQAFTTVVSQLVLEAGPDQSAVEGDRVELLAAWVTAFEGIENLTGTVSWGDGSIDPISLVAGNDVLMIANAHVYGDNGEYTVLLTISDSFGFTVSDQLQVIVSNAAPIATIVGPVSGVRGQPRIFEGMFSDPGSADTHIEAWQVLADDDSILVTGSESNISFTPLEIGSYRILYTVTDDDGDADTVTQILTVTIVEMQTDPLDPQATLLAIGGTPASDFIELRTGFNSEEVVVTIDRVLFGLFTPQRIEVYAQAGDDTVILSPGVTQPARLFGGEGRDRMMASSGRDQLFGGPGDDFLIGGGGASELDGGEGDNRLLPNGTFQDLFQNPWMRYDVNDSGTVTPLDALQIINVLSRLGTPSFDLAPSDQPLPNLPRYPDVSGDGKISSLDALQVINWQSRNQQLGEGERETVLGMETALPWLDLAVQQESQWPALPFREDRFDHLPMDFIRRNSSAYLNSDAVDAIDDVLRTGSTDAVDTVTSDLVSLQLQPKLIAPILDFAPDTLAHDLALMMDLSESFDADLVTEPELLRS